MSARFGTATVDTLIGFRKQRHVAPIPALRGSDATTHHPHGYLFRDNIPAELDKPEDPAVSIAETLAQMDRHGIEWGLINLNDELAPAALAAHPDRFVAALPVDGNRGMEQVRDIVRAHAEHDIRAVTLFPSGVSPQLPINDKHWYPIYAKCVELGIAAFVTTGVPGPRVPMMAQYTGWLDEVCFDFPELTLVMRHGAEPWEELAVKLMLKWPGLHYSTSAFAPKHYPKAIVDFANKRGTDKILYAGYYPYGLELDRIFTELEQVPFRDHVWVKFLSENARRILKLPEAAA